MSAESHTADNIVTAVEECLKRLGLQMKQFDWIISDSPSVMVSARKKLAEAYPHLGTFGCTVHLVHNMVSAITKLAMVSDVLTNNSVLINIFNRSHIWDSRLKEFQIQRNIPGLCGYSKISMYSVYQSTASVLLNKEGIISLANHDETEISQEGLPKAVSNVIENSQHWADNEAVVALVKPFADAIEAIETRQFTLSETYLELLRLGEKTINSLSNDALVDARYTNIKSKVLSIYNHYMSTLDHDLCIVALFLHPRARQLAVSHKYKLDDIKLIAKGIVRRWRWQKPFMEKLMHQIDQYAHCIGPFSADDDVPDDHPLVYWAYIDRMKANELVSFASRVLSLVPHSAKPDSIFSILAQYNTKGRNGLNVASLRILAQVKLWLLQKMKTVQKGVPSDSEFIASSTVDIVPGDEVGQLELEDWGESLESTTLDEVKTEFMSLEMAVQEANVVRFEENGDVPIGDTLVSGNLNVRKIYSPVSQSLEMREVAEYVDLGY
ncbi:ribonuclease H-like domain-containing protein [Paraphysoderma sedebokerense]|nr:ribonuclease H-like domain-containing protein [Paraphysoderma sedebokerense]KAI9138260.1 ribonuclease H-like domain-containing protein [Paraphysoderma sedebokerense]